MNDVELILLALSIAWAAYEVAKLLLIAALARRIDRAAGKAERAVIEAFIQHIEDRKSE